MKLINLHPSAGVAAFAVRDSGYSPASDVDDAQAIGICVQCRNLEILCESTLGAAAAAHAVYHRA